MIWPINLWFSVCLFFSCLLYPYCQGKEVEIKGNYAVSLLEETIDYFRLRRVTLLCRIPKKQIFLLHRSKMVNFKFNARDIRKSEKWLTKKGDLLLCSEKDNFSNETFTEEIFRDFEKKVILCADSGQSERVIRQFSDLLRIGDEVYFYEKNKKTVQEAYSLQKGKVVIRQIATKLKPELFMDESETFVQRRMNLEGINLRTLIESQKPFITLKAKVNGEERKKVNKDIFCFKKKFIY